MISFSASPAQRFNPTFGHHGLKRTVTMQKDDEDPVFVINMTRYPSDAYKKEYDLRAVNLITSQLTRNNGAFFTMCGQENPFELLKLMKKREYKFSRYAATCLRITKSPGGKYIDVGGNLEQVSNVFRYRFYDQSLYTKWIEEAKLVDPHGVAIKH